MKANVIVVKEWPEPDTVSPATTVMLGSKLVVGYGTGEDQYALISFNSATNVKVGGPNDEALHGHPLYSCGLKHYAIHRIEGSPWLEELEGQNAVHSQHDRQRFLQNKVHYLFALKEETVECIVRERAGESPSVEVFSSYQTALQSLRERVGA